MDRRLFVGLLLAPALLLWALRQQGRPPAPNPGELATLLYPRGIDATLPAGVEVVAVTTRPVWVVVTYRRPVPAGSESITVTYRRSAYTEAL